MKYLKFYENVDEDIISLSDCLFEVFEKFGIKEYDPSETYYPNHHISSLNQSRWNCIDDRIIIDDIPIKYVMDVFNEIKRIQPMIEKRIGKEIYVGIGENGYVKSVKWIIISLSD